MKPLQLPPTLRVPNPDEVPKRPELLKRLEERHSAKIVEGYKLLPNSSSDFPFAFYAEINIDNENLWSLFKTLMLQLPEEVSLIYGHIDDEATFGEYMDKYEVLSVLDPFKLELTQDGYLEFGVIFHDQEYMEEVFVKKGKYLQYWGMDEDRFRKTMLEYDLCEVPNLNFVDEYPLVTEALKRHQPGSVDTSELIAKLHSIFNNDAS